ncbi:MAG: Type 1 glutamine amidotransferase-like domain-containing protein [Candidatus Woesearchaeota archaeon]
MKLILTSAGLTNKSIVKAFQELAGENPRIAFIPTASNIEKGDKDWLIANYAECDSVGELDIVDISALPKEEWLPRLQMAQVIFVGGGNTGYLLDWMRKSGLDKELPELLKTRLYVGISAGSVALSKRIWADSEWLYGDELQKAPAGLGYIDFNFRPHLNSKYFTQARIENIEPVAKRLEGPLYACDDDTALVVDEEKITVVSEGTWRKFE